MLFGIFEAVLLTAIISADALAAGFAYGGSGIKIGFLKSLLISLVCSGFLAISLFAGAAVRDVIPEWLTVWIGFAILFFIGLCKLLGSLTKKSTAKDNLTPITLKETVLLAAALSIDGLAAGFGFAMGHVSALLVIVCSLVITVTAVMAGCRLGAKVTARVNLSWAAGALLMAMAIGRLM